jgi:hypothetical protein
VALLAAVWAGCLLPDARYEQVRLEADGGAVVTEVQNVQGEDAGPPEQNDTGGAPFAPDASAMTGSEGAGPAIPVAQTEPEPMLMTEPAAPEPPIENSCNDNISNLGETGVDCGGSCDRTCSNGAACAIASDCQSGVCATAGCAPGVELCCQAPSCSDGVANGAEPVPDCGNVVCGLCALDAACTSSVQCQSGSCGANGVCRPPCSDGRRNQTETDVDCGGDCGVCDPGRACSTDADCASGACQGGRCCGGTLADCTRCALRLAVSVNCNDGAPGDADACSAFLQCLADNPGACPTRLTVGCTDAGGACDASAFGGNGSAGVVLADRILGTAQCSF